MGLEEFLLDQAKNDGIEKGIEQGIEKGLKKGKLKEARAIALELKKEGLVIEFIAKTTKLSIYEIEKL